MPLHEFHAGGKSSTIRHVSWAEGLLQVTFKSGGIYTVPDVPFETYVAFSMDQSAGRFYHHVIKKNFRPVRLIKEETDAPSD